MLALRIGSAGRYRCSVNAALTPGLALQPAALAAVLASYPGAPERACARKASEV